MSPKFRAYIITALKTLAVLEILGGIIMGCVAADGAHEVATAYSYIDSPAETSGGNSIALWFGWTFVGIASAILTYGFTILVEAAHWYITGKEPTEDED